MHPLLEEVYRFSDDTVRDHEKTMDIPFVIAGLLDDKLPMVMHFDLALILAAGVAAKEPEILKAIYEAYATDVSENVGVLLNFNKDVQEFIDRMKKIINAPKIPSYIELTFQQIKEFYKPFKGREPDCYLRHRVDGALTDAWERSLFIVTRIARESFIDEIKLDEPYYTGRVELSSWTPDHFCVVIPESALVQS